jgi:phage shock protein PspC (stress-responsive transcriptional regulator)
MWLGIMSKEFEANLNIFEVFWNRGERGARSMRLRRATRDRWIWGVCGGIARYYGWNSTVVRIVVVLLAIFIPGVSVIPAVLIYVLLGFLLPEAEEF